MNVLIQWRRPVEISGLILFLLLGWLYGRETPLLETPDEPSHFAVVKYIADTKSLPPPTLAPAYPGAVPVIAPGVPVYYAPPLYYVLAAALIQDLDTGGFAQAVIPNPGWARGWAPTPGWDAFNKNAYVHTSGQQQPYAGWAVALWRLRRLSLLLGAATVLGSFFLARQLWPQPEDRGWVWSATALVALNTTYLFTSNGVTNDALLIPLATWSFVLMGSLLSRQNRTGPATWQGAALALLVGLAILTKQSAFFLVPLAVATVYLKARSQQWSWRRLSAALLAGGLIVGLAGGWWYAYNGLVYGDFLGLFSHETLASEGALLTRLSFLAEQAWGAFKSYWAAFGWALIFVRPGWYVFFALLTLGGLWGWLRYQGKETAGTWGQGMATLLAGAILLNGILLLLWLWRIAAPYGRLLFPSIAPLACLIVEGWRRWLTQSRLSRFPYLARLWQAMLLVALAALAAVIPFAYLRPAFASPLVHSAPPEMVAAPAHFDSAGQLLGYQVTPESITPGETVDLTLYWQAAAVPAGAPDLMVFVQLAPQDVQKKVISRDEFLGTPRYPTSVWRGGDVVAQRHTLPVPLTAAAPALYWFNVGLYEDNPRRDLPAESQSQPVVETMVRLGPVRMKARAGQVPPPPRPAHYDFAGTIRLYGYDLAWMPGTNTVTLDLYWQALSKPTADWNVFVHLVDAAGNLIAQHDGPPQSGDYPTYWWQPSDRIVDRHLLALPGTITTATMVEGAQLKVGLYNWLDGQRLPVTNAPGATVPEVSLDFVVDE